MNLTQYRSGWLLYWLVLLNTATAAAPQQEELLQAETIFQLSLGNQIISDGLFAYQLNNQIYLPLGELTRVLEFPIMLGPDGQRAEGWFISPRQTLSLDLKNKKIQIKEKPQPYPKDIFSSEDEIYISSHALSHWFGLIFEVSLASLSINISSKQLLPIQQRSQRDKRYGNFSKSPALRPTLPYTQIPYSLYATPAASINLDSNYNHINKMGKFGYSAQLHGDLLYHSGQLFLNGDDQNGLKNLRLQLGKQDYNNRLLGSLHASHYQLGDISVQSRALIGGNFSGRGFKFSSTPINQSSEFNRITLEGDLQPQYDVELYRNGGLYEFQRSNDEGRYKFDNVPLFQGMNVLKLIFYGPQGQQYEKIQRLYSDGATAKKGQLNYRFSLTQPSQKVFSLDNKPQSEDPSLSWLASASYGLGNKLSITGSLAQYEKEQQQQSFANLGLRGTVGPLLMQSEVSLDKKGEAAGVIGLQTKVKSVRIDLSHTQYSLTFNNSDNSNSNPLQQSSQLRLEGSPFLVGSLGRLSPFNLTLSQSRQFNGFSNERLDHNFWLAIGSANFSNDLHYQDNGNTQQLYGNARLNLNANSFIKGFNLRSDVNYSIDPEQLTQNASMGTIYQISNKGNLSFSANRNYQTDKQTIHYSLGYNQRFDVLNLGVNLSGSEENDLFIGAKLSFSVLPDPIQQRPQFHASTSKAQEGSILAVSYLDENRNNKRDFWEKPISDIGFTVNRGYRPGLTNRNGEVLISGLNTGRKIDIQLNPSTLGDPYLLSSSEGYGISPRPGHIMRLEFPLVNIGEIDGHVYLLRNGEKIEAANVSMELINAESGKLVALLRSEYDGYFYLPNVNPGKYRFRVEPNLIKRLKLSAPKPFEIEIKGSGESITIPDIVLKRLKQEVRFSQTATKGKKL